MSLQSSLGQNWPQNEGIAGPNENVQVSKQNRDYLSDEQRKDLEDLESIKKQLDAIKAWGKYVGTRVTILQNHADRLTDEWIPEDERHEYDWLIRQINHFISEYKKLHDEGEYIDTIVRLRLDELDESVGEAIEEITWESYDKASFEYSSENLVELREQSEVLVWDIRAKFVWEFLWEADTWKVLGDYKDHQKVQELSKKHKEGFEYGYDMESTLARFDWVKREEDIQAHERGDTQNRSAILESAISEYTQIQRDMEIIIRDSKIIEWERNLWKIRLEGTHEYYNSLMLWEDGELTKLWEKIATKDWKLPEFEDLGMNHIDILIKEWADLRKLFLTDTLWKRFPWWDLEEWKTYIINFSINSELADKMDFAFIDHSVKSVEIDGEKYTLQADSENPHGVGYYNQDGHKINLQDGSSIKIFSEKTENISDVQKQVQEKLSKYAQQSTKHQAFVEAVYANPNTAFDGLTLPAWAWWAGHIMAFLAGFYYGKNLRYDNETGNIYEVIEDGEDRVLTNREVAWAYVWSMELWSLSAEYESGSNGPFAYNPNDNGAGPSYGSYQMNTDKWCYKDFAKKHNISPWYAWWKAKIAEVGWAEAFHKLEHQYIKETHFDVMMWKISVAWKENFSLAFQNVIWSSAVQHGPHKSSIINAVNSSGVTPGDIKSEAQLINMIYDIRWRLWPAGVHSRYNSERTRALQMLNTIAIWGIISEWNIYDQSIWNIPDNFVSSKAERNPSTQVTLCSKTARINLSRLWVQNVHQWSSAKKSFDKYPWDMIQAFPPKNSTDAKVADFYLDASLKNKQYGHRAACFKIDGKWFVLDPYYKIPWYTNDRTGPIPAETYIDHMQNKLGRRIWWAAYFK